MKCKIACVGLAVGLGCWLALSGVMLAGPTPAQRAEIQRLINQGHGLRSAWEVQRDLGSRFFDQWRESGDEDDRQAATATLRSANDLLKRLKANRDSIIDMVDSVFDCGMPAGTQVEYDPRCGSYGYTSPRCYVRLCERPFNNPDDVASTKMHEAEHVRQKLNGIWGLGNEPRKCSARHHWMEYEARQAQLKAHADGKITLDSLSIRRLEYEKEYCQMHFSKRAQSKFEGMKRVSSLPGRNVTKYAVITNDSDEPMEIDGEFTNREGWPMLPPGFSLLLDSEEEAVIEVNMEVPPETEPGTVNEALCHAYPALTALRHGFTVFQTDTATDFFFVDVTATVEVLPGPDAGGLPEDSVTFYFTVTNLGAAADIFQVNLESTLGWPVSPDFWNVPLNPSESIDLESGVIIPESPTFTTDLVRCHAVSTTIPGQVDSCWLYVQVEADAGIHNGDDDYSFALMPGEPNPFTSTTLIRFSIPTASRVELCLYDVRGRLVRTLIGAGSGVLNPGIHSLKWDGKDRQGREVASGVYFYRLRASGRTAARKIVALR